MQLNHLNLPVQNVTEARALFEELFGFTSQFQIKEMIAGLSGENGFNLVLSHAPALAEQPPVFPEGFHVGFLLETPEEVDRAYERVTTYGLVPGHPPRNLQKRYSFYFNALNGIQFEIGCPHD